jgi:hypothetical protein
MTASCLVRIEERRYAALLEHAFAKIEEVRP